MTEKITFEDDTDDASKACHIVGGTLVPHTAFEEGMGMLDLCFRQSKGSPDPICISVLGETRTGKSRLLEEFASKHPRRRFPEGVVMPILQVYCPAKPTVKGLAEKLLRELGDEAADKGSEQSKTRRLQVLLENTKVRMVIIDEFQHFYDKGTRKIMFHVADWLKNLIEESKVALVVSGLPTCEHILQQNAQLKGRLYAPIVMPRFDWTNDEQREEFIAILGAFEEAMGAHYDIPTFTSDEMAFRFYCGTGGLMGYLSKFLRMAEGLALMSNSRIISLADLQIAHFKSVWDKESHIKLPSPFTAQWKMTATVELLRTVSQLGKDQEIADPRDNRQSKSIAPRLSSILSAS